MVVAQRTSTRSRFDPKGTDRSRQDLTLLAMVGIVDPPRAEAKAAIAKCHDAGFRVRMITGTMPPPLLPSPGSSASKAGRSPAPSSPR